MPIETLIVLIVVIVIALSIILLVYRNKALERQEEIRAAKSKVRVAKAKYIKVMANSTKTNLSANSANTAAGGFVDGGSGGVGGTFVTSTAMVERLATEYENAQLQLNELVSSWNVFVGRFPNMIFAAILRLKKEIYIDEENLEMSTELSGTIDDDVV